MVYYTYYKFKNVLYYFMQNNSSILIFMILFLYSLLQHIWNICYAVSKIYFGSSSLYGITVTTCFHVYWNLNYVYKFSRREYSNYILMNPIIWDLRKYILLHILVFLLNVATVLVKRFQKTVLQFRLNNPLSNHCLISIL